jgi:hypothetical protein
MELQLSRSPAPIEPSEIIAVFRSSKLLHEARPPHARLLARSFGEFMEELLEYEAFIR